MKQYKKWATAGVALTIMGTVAGCSTNGDVSPGSNATNSTKDVAPSNNTVANRTAGENNATANTSAPSINTATTNSTNTVTSMVSVTVSLTNGQSTPSISFKVPSEWVKQKVGQGDSSGYAWVNPHDASQQIDVITSGNISAIKNYTTEQWDVTGIFGHGTRGISWIGVSSDKLTGSFIDTTGMNPYAKSEQTPYTGYGKAFIVQSPNPFSVFVEAWGMPLHADTVLPTIHLHETVYVFSQAMLKEIYAVKYLSSVGPIIPPQNVANDVNKWAPYVSMSMLPYAPASEQVLDKQLIQNIQGPMTLLKSLSGYTLHHEQLPSGNRTYWYPSNNKFPTWVDPTPQQIIK
ncbi:hypothetical protein Alches_13270 [Alicyclobacillus hesperidum subsp. aegles]|uniref:hypothetical protein n=1 Tax=Alicyclobacillus hesperidum TaxID=89784 RepID=UPI00222AF10D|nr:hypothetical protein [Alicyclobacillus hesperidum]GLG01288.1 hypothetical protein Alches_13270 [Alicyclobacillus hesperidum subsp. aegles]